MIEKIEREFKNKVCSQINILSEGINRYRIINPFMFEDGDHLVLYLKIENNEWILSDEGHTFMHLSYELDIRDLQRGTRKDIIENAISNFNIRNRNNELIIYIENEEYGDALFSFIQGLLKISDVTYLTKERVRSTFFEDFKEILSTNISEERLFFNWHDPEKDPQGNYEVNCRINGIDNPLLVFALQSDDQVRDATITLHQFEKWAFNFRTLAIFDDQEEINRRVLARFSDVADKQFSSLSGNKERISHYLKSMIH